MLIHTLKKALIQGSVTYLLKYTTERRFRPGRLAAAFRQVDFYTPDK